MSVMEIPESTYLAIYEDQVAWLVKRGAWLDEARRGAAEIMRNSFVARTTAVQCDTDKDYDPWTRDLRDDWWTKLP